MNRVAIIAGARSPFVRAGGALAQYSFLDLGVHAVKSLLERSKLDPAGVEELIFGTVLLDPRTPNAARELVIRSGLPKSLSAHFVSNNCISGLVAATFIADAIRTGRISTGIAAGSESMSRPTLTLRPAAENFFLKLARARSVAERLKLFGRFRPGYLFPQPPSPKEPSTGLTMGEHCELMAKEYRISREWQDKIAFRSHQAAARAQKEGVLGEEIAALGGADRDNIVRAETSLEKLAGLRPVFDRSSQGTLTAGNSSALTDGSSAVLLMSESQAKKEGRPILAYLEQSEFAAISADDGLLMAPGIALPRLLEKTKLSVADVDYFEIHEAFGAQVAANLLIWEQGWSKYPQAKAIGRIPDEKINVNGGSIALGHPFAATGGRLIMSLANQLQRSGKKTGVISVCAAGAMACAMLIRRE